MVCLVLNSGSSSIKFGLFELSGKNVCGGSVSRIGEGSATVKFSCAEKSVQYDAEESSIKDHEGSMNRIIDLLKEHGFIGDRVSLNVVGHRIVHGGIRFEAPAVVDDEVETAIEKNVPLAPLHNPAGLLGIRVARRILPDVPHVAVFDTAFHSSMPPESYRYALPKELFENYDVRRYGFHGTSYGYVLGHVSKTLSSKSPNVIIFHLGNGASAACVKRGACVDTTMGLTPLEGLMMGTRCGDVDAGVFSFLCRQGHSPEEVDAILNKRSGLLGVSGVSADMRTVAEAASQGNQDASLARDIYVQRIRKYLGAYLVKLDGQCDAIAFTAGVGENDAQLREKVCQNLSRLGIALDLEKNLQANKSNEIFEISEAGSAIKVFVVPTNEEQSIALQSAQAAGIHPDPTK